MNFKNIVALIALVAVVGVLAMPVAQAAYTCPAGATCTSSIGSYTIVKPNWQPTGTNFLQRFSQWIFHCIRYNLCFKPV